MKALLTDVEEALSNGCTIPTEMFAAGDPFFGHFTSTIPTLLLPSSKPDWLSFADRSVGYHTPEVEGSCLNLLARGAKLETGASDFSSADSLCADRRSGRTIDRLSSAFSVNIGMEDTRGWETVCKLRM